MKIVPSKRQLPPGAKAYYITWRHWNWRKRCINSDFGAQWTNDQYFVLLQSIGVDGKPSPVEHLRIYISWPCRSAPHNANFRLSASSYYSSVYSMQTDSGTDRKAIAWALKTKLHITTPHISERFRDKELIYKR